MNLFNLIDNNVINRLVIVEQNGLLEPMVPYEVKNHIEYTLRHNSEKVGHITRLAIANTTNKLSVMVLLATGEEVMYNLEDVFFI